MVNWIVPFYYLPIHVYIIIKLVAFTNQTLIFTTGSLCYSYWAARCPKHFGKLSLYKQDPDELNQTIKHQAIHNLLYQLMVICNFITMIVYWPLLHQDFMEKMKGKPIVLFHFYTIHSFPFIACLINVYCTNCILRESLWTLILKFSIFYIGLYYIFTK